MADQKKLDVLHVTPFFPPSIGGISNLVHNLSSALKQFDNNIYIITARNLTDRQDHPERISAQICEIKSVYFPGWPYSTLRNFSFPLDLGLKIDSVIKHGRFDVVHVHGHHYPIGWIALYAANRKNIPTVLSLHGTYALNPKVLGGRSKIEDLFNRYIFRNILSKCNVIIGGTQQIIEYAKMYSSPSNIFKIVSNGVNTGRYIANLDKKKEFRKSFKLDQDKLTVLFVGRFDESKGALEFAQTANLILKNNDSKFQVIMVGKGELESEIRSIVKGLNNMHLVEWQSADRIHELYIASDIFVLPSKFEGLPLSVIEAMNANLHIVYSNVGGVHDILSRYSKKSILDDVTPNEISKILLMLSLNRSLTDVHQPSLAYAQTFDWMNIAKSVSLIYQELHKIKQKE